MKKQTIQQRFLNFFIGVDSARDEYEQAEINKVLANLALMMWCSNILLMFFVIYVDQMTNSISLASVWLSVTNLALSLYLLIRLTRAGLNRTEFESKEALRIYKNKAKKKSFTQGFILSTIVYSIAIVFIPVITNELVRFDFVIFILFMLISTAGIGSIFYLLIRMRLKVYEEE